MKPSRKQLALEALKAARKQARELDIQLHGKPTAMRPCVIPSKKVYRRKKEKFLEES